MKKSANDVRGSQYTGFISSPDALAQKYPPRAICKKFILQYNT